VLSRSDGSCMPVIRLEVQYAAGLLSCCVLLDLGPINPK
jgi:hypothetical protein